MIEVGGVKVALKVNTLWAVIKYEELSGKRWGDPMGLTEMVKYIYAGYFAGQKIAGGEIISFDQFVDEVQDIDKLTELMESINPTRPQVID